MIQNGQMISGRYKRKKERDSEYTVNPPKYLLLHVPIYSNKILEIKSCSNMNFDESNSKKQIISQNSKRIQNIPLVLKKIFNQACYQIVKS